MKIVADANMPLLAELFRPHGEVVALPGRAIDAAAVRDAAVLLVRSVTRVDATLLAGSAVDRALRLGASISFLREMAIGAAIILFLIFEPDGLARRWRLIRAYWKLYPYSH